MIYSKYKKYCFKGVSMKKSIIVTSALLFTAIFSLGISTGVQKVSAEAVQDDLSFPVQSMVAIARDTGTELDYTPSYVYTPNGTQVATKQYVEMSEEDILYYTYMGGSLYSGAILLDYATTAYNCHSYAWYQSMTTNQHWMPDPSAYITDGSYYEVTQPAVGDVICYYTSSGENVHSGIIVGLETPIEDLSSITIESKWADWGLYRHTADNCPFSPEYNSDVEYVKYYRHTKHTYNQECVYLNTKNHKTYCICGQYTISRHSVRAGESSGRYARCIGCGAQLDLWSDVYPALPYAINQEKRGSYILPNGIAVIAEEDMELFERGQLIINGYLVV